MAVAPRGVRDRLLALVPLSLPLFLSFRLIGSPIPIARGWIETYVPLRTKAPSPTAAPADGGGGELLTDEDSTVRSQLLAYAIVAAAGYWACDRMVPPIKEYTLRKGIAGKDLGKIGTAAADKPVPEALGIVPGGVFLVCLIFCLVGFAASFQQLDHKLLDVNSALLSVCFMLFLGFTDDVLDWPWRYKLVLPSVASLPLLCSYNGSTTVVVPLQLRSWLWDSSQQTATWLGNLVGIGNLIIIDAKASGSLLDLGYFYLLYMGMLAVFCTNAINIFAGINGLEAGQSYVIGCAILVHNLVEIAAGRSVESHLFSVMVMLSFVGVTGGLLKHNWYPASVFVGDTYCYFAGMTFAVVGILGHFSKTLLLFFIPQVVNFLWSVPQLFKLVHCPRHRLPRFDPKTGLMYPSTFTCKPNQYRWLKAKPNDTEVVNMTVINMWLQIWGPMNERDLCIRLLRLQMVCCAIGFLCRYYVAGFFFDD